MWRRYTEEAKEGNPMRGRRGLKHFFCRVYRTAESKNKHGCIEVLLFVSNRSTRQRVERQGLVHVDAPVELTQVVHVADRARAPRQQAQRHVAKGRLVFLPLGLIVTAATASATTAAASCGRTAIG